MSYQLKIYDNFHYMDEEETYLHGQFATYEEALKAAKNIVEEHFKFNYKPGITESEMTANYTMFGEDPIIINASGEVQKFSAWKYAEKYARSYYEKMKKEQFFQL